MLNDIDWTNVLSSDDVNSQWEAFKSIYNKLESDCIPRKKVYVNGKLAKKTFNTPRPKNSKEY